MLNDKEMKWYLESLNLKDTASIRSMAETDKARLFYLRQDNRIKLGQEIIIKEGAVFTLCDNAKLEIGDFCMFARDSEIIMTKPTPRLKIGKFVSLQRYSIIACKGNIEIGDYTMIAPFVHIVDHEHGMKLDKPMFFQKSKVGFVKIGSDVWIGSGARILMGVTIGEGAVIGANSVVNTDIPPYAIAVGTPAQVKKYRK